MSAYWSLCICQICAFSPFSLFIPVLFALYLLVADVSWWFLVIYVPEVTLNVYPWFFVAITCFGLISFLFFLRQGCGLYVVVVRFGFFSFCQSFFWSVFFLCLMHPLVPLYWSNQFCAGFYQFCAGFFNKFYKLYLAVLFPLRELGLYFI